MSYLPTAPGAAERESALSARQGRRWDRLLDRGHWLAIVAAVEPFRAIGAILLLNLVLTAVFVVAGELVFSDPAELFRELMPGTWLSFAELLFVAVIAWSVQLAAFGVRRIRLDNLWGLTAVVFTVFAFDEITQLTVFLSHALTSLGALAPEGFKDLDAFLLTVLFLAAAAAMLRHIGDLLPHRAAIAVLSIGVLLGIASQALDSALKSTSGEFVAEESLKLAAEPFLIGGYLLVLRSFVAARRRGS